MKEKPIVPPSQSAPVASHPPAPVVAANLKKFLAERAVRAERLLHKGEVGFCKDCGKTDPNIYWPSRMMFCRRRRCKTCRARRQAEFAASVLAHVPFPK